MGYGLREGLRTPSIATTGLSDEPPYDNDHVLREKVSEKRYPKVDDDRYPPLGAPEELLN